MKSLSDIIRVPMLPIFLGIPESPAVSAAFYLTGSKNVLCKIS